MRILMFFSDGLSLQYTLAVFSPNTCRVLQLSVLCTRSRWVAYMSMLLPSTSLKIYHFTIHGSTVTQYLQGAHHFSRQGTSFQCVTCKSMLLHRIGSIRYTLAVLSLSTDKVHLMIQSTSLQCRGFMFVLLHSTEVITYPSIYTGNISLPVFTGCSTTSLCGTLALRALHTGFVLLHSTSLNIHVPHQYSTSVKRNARRCRACNA